MMQFPIGTGAVCALVCVSEHRARNQIRSGKLHVPCVGGRRMWFPAQIMELARRTGRDTPEVRNACREQDAVQEAPVIHAQPTVT